MDGTPRISVIIPTHNRKRLLERTLRALDGQRMPRDRFEVLVADDGSTDRTPDMVERLSGVVRYPLTCLRQPNRGPAAARNLGMEHARGEIVAFTDDDCLPEPQWLEEVEKAFQDPGVRAVSGPVWSEIPPGVFVHSLVSYSSTVSSADHFMTSNFSVRRSAAEQIGRFDTRFRDPWFEDYDFAYRIRDAGGRIAIAPEARVYHPIQYQPYLRYLRKTRFCRYSALMQRKYPGKGFGLEIRGRLRHMGKILLVIFIPAVLPVPGTTAGIRLALLWGAAAFLAARRIRPILRDLADRNFRVKKKDQAAFVLFSWMEGLLRGVYTLLGLWEFTLDRGKAFLKTSELARLLKWRAGRRT